MPVLAAEPPNFHAKTNDNILLRLKTFTDTLNIDSITSPVIAKYDLNNDSIPEYIVKDKNCLDTESLCDFLIIAEAAHNGFIKIGQFSARAIKISNNTTFGVRDLNIYNNNRNHFHFLTVKWNNTVSHYILENLEDTQ